MQIHLSVGMEIYGPSDGNRKSMMVIMTRDEAISTIRGLAQQIESGSPNSGRYEKFCECGTLFSIAVVDDA